jgi:hypothetical protein
VNNRLLGTIAMICAPAMLVEALVPNSTENPFLVGTCSMVFMLGSLCSHIGLWRIASTGTSWWGRFVLGVQLLLVSLAFLFGLLEATGLVGDESIVFMVTDMSWPLSMVWMLVGGITAAIVGKLRGWHRFVPLLCGLAFPLSIVIGILGSFDMQSMEMGLVFFGMLALFWGLLGFVVRQSEEIPARAPAAMQSSANTAQ